MKMRKIIAAIAAAAVAVSAMAINTFALDDGTAYIMFSDANWGDAQWWDDGAEHAGATEQTALITGDGQYTVSATCTAPGSSFAFAALGVTNGETVFGAETLVMTIDSVKVDGVEVQPAGTAYTSSDDQICTRVNLYNGWVTSLPDDARTANGATDGTPTAYDLPSIGEWSTIEVTFTVSGTGSAAAEEAPAEEAPAADTATTSTDTGNTAAAAIASVMVVAGIAAVATKKRK